MEWWNPILEYSLEYVDSSLFFTFGGAMEFKKDYTESSCLGCNVIEFGGILLELVKILKNKNEYPKMTIKSNNFHFKWEKWVPSLHLVNSNPKKVKVLYMASSLSPP